MTGEIANDYIEGACCSGCMCYFEEEHGYPVLCKACWDEYSKKEREGYSLAIYKEL